MKQVLQNLQTGATEVADVPCPKAGRGQLLVRSTRTLVSAGTERMLVEFGRAGWIEKARQQPERVRAVIEKIGTDGLLPTIESIRNKLDKPIAMGYCSVGRVIAVGDGVTQFQVGDVVASNGRHAEMVCVPVNLCAKVPAQVCADDAAFTVMGAIALQGIRLAQPTLGEAVVVTGLGLIGLICVQLLRAHGCRVLGIDFDPQRLELARGFGAEVVSLNAGEDPVAAAQTFSRGRGVDAVIVAASSKSSEPIRQAALMSRKRGRIVLVGVTGLELARADFYEKELTFQVSCSYGPGRYDPSYEEGGHDYPVGYVRWTEQRNFEAVLDMLAERRLNVQPLITHRFGIDDAARAYDVIGGTEASLGVLLDYADESERPTQTLLRSSVAGSARAQAGEAGVVVGLIGAGNYASGALLPALKASGANVRSIASVGGVTALHGARKFGGEQASTDPDAVITDPLINTVIVATRHDSHAAYVLRARAHGKHVFVEKPLCLTLSELASIESAWSAGDAPLLMVGFNRRFAPHVRRVKDLLLATPGPKAFVVTVNAGAIPSSHWTQDGDRGGGRIVGEACHFIDLLRHLAGAPIAAHAVTPMSSATSDSVAMTLRFADGSIGTINYLANGSKAFPKERLEVFAAGRVLQLDNFRRLAGYGWPEFRKMNLWRQDKGQVPCIQAFLSAARSGGPAPIPLTEIFEVSRVSIEAQQAILSSFSQANAHTQQSSTRA